jgi:hypothetical protein
MFDGGGETNNRTGVCTRAVPPERKKGAPERALPRIKRARTSA